MNIRKYQEKDKDRVREICILTAGEYFKKSRKRLESVPIIFNDYFTTYEKENIFVLVDDLGVIEGYIICSTDYNKFMEKYKDIYLKQVKKIGFLETFVLKIYMKQLKKIKDKSIHLHIDIIEEYRGQGFGTKLIDTLKDHLKEKGFSHLSICAVNRKSDGYKFYKKCGFFEIFDYGFNEVALSINL